MQWAKASGVELLALSDHDTVDGVQEAMRTGADAGVRVVPGAEISALDEDREDLHILGYLLDPGDSALNDALVEFRVDREARAERMADALEELGFELDLTEIARRRAAGKPIGRPHLARAAFEHPANAERVADERLLTSSDLLEAYLIEGAPAYRRRTTPTVARAIEVIHDAGGVAVWAHPFWDLDEPGAVSETIGRFKALGIDGVETFYVTNSEEKTRMTYEAATAHGLLTTGSADFHAPDHPIFNAFLAFDLHGLTPNLGPIDASVG